MSAERDFRTDFLDTGVLLGIVESELPIRGVCYDPAGGYVVLQHGAEGAVRFLDRSLFSEEFLERRVAGRVVRHPSARGVEG